MPESEGKGSFVAFWSTLPGILTGLAALITAVGGLITVILVSRPAEQDSPPAATSQPVPTPLSTVRPPAGASGGPAVLPSVPPVTPAAALASATAIPPGISRSVVGPAATTYHRFDVPAASLAEGDVDSTQTCVRIAPLDAAGNAVFHPGGACTTSEYFSILTSGTAGGAYYLQVVSGSAIAQGEYTVNLRIRGQDDASAKSDAPGVPEQAMSLSPSRAYQGLVGSQDPVDYYQFQAAPGLKLECLYDQEDNVVIALQQVDAGGRVLAEERVLRGGRVDFASRPAGRYLLRLSNQGQGAQYTLIFAGG